MSSPDPSYGMKKSHMSTKSNYFHSIFLRILKVHKWISLPHKLIRRLSGESLVLSKYKLTGGFDPTSPFLASDQKATHHEF